MDEPFEKKRLRLLQRGDAPAIEQWFNDYADSLYTFVYYRAGADSGLASDIVQETFVTGLKRIGQYDPKRGSMFAWLSWLSRNCTKKVLRADTPYERTWADIDSSLLQAYQRIATEPLPDEIVEQRETAALVQITLANIPANYKHVLKEYYYNLKSLRDIAVSAGTNEGAVKAMLYRARKAFKQAFLKLSDSFSTGIPEGGADE